ncbi:cytochrome P450 71A3-like [Silene latifolia]|uniref:cytochrome P450 71A3-like n=1 Tax=Silene latifolia TaxID=37657 RepID=UPI003D78B0FB
MAFDATFVQLPPSMIRLQTLPWTVHLVLNIGIFDRLQSSSCCTIIGNLHQLGKLPHRFLRSLSERYGDLMLLHLGTKPILVVSSANGAEEIMKTHDINFANRPYSKIAALVIYDGKDIAFGKYGEHWRKLKSICVLNMLSNKKVRSFRKIREEEVGLMVESIQKSTPNSPLNLSNTFMKLISDLVFRALFGKNCGEEYLGPLLKELSEAVGSFIFGDFIRWLGWIDEFSGVLSKGRKVARSLDSLIQKRVEEHINGFDDDGRNQEDKIQYLVDVLLESQRNDSSIDMDTVKALLMDMITAGIETTATLLEWTMSELLMHPLVMKRLQKELRGFLRGKTVINEDDLKDMMYLKAVIKESLRLHPPLPFLLFRESSQDARVQNYDIRLWNTSYHQRVGPTTTPDLLGRAEELDERDFLTIRGMTLDSFRLEVEDEVATGLLSLMLKFELALAKSCRSLQLEVADEVNVDSFMAESFGASLRRRDPFIAIPTPYSNY